MKLSITYDKKSKRHWVLYREGGTREQHSHFYTKSNAKYCRKLIDKNCLPISEEYQIAVRRLLTDKEFETLSKKEKYYKRRGGEPTPSGVR